MCLQFTVHVVLCPMLNVFAFILLHPEERMQCPKCLFSVLPWLRTSHICSLGIFLNASTTVPVSLIITGITFVFTFYMRSISIVRPSYFKIFSAFLNHVSISCNCLTYSFSLWRIIMSGWLVGSFCHFSILIPDLHDIF
jgi:hypothetical protein